MHKRVFTFPGGNVKGCAGGRWNASWRNETKYGRISQFYSQRTYHIKPLPPPSSPQILLFSLFIPWWWTGGGQTIFLLLGGDGVGLLEKPSQAAQSVACPAMINPPHLCTVLSTVYSDFTLWSLISTTWLHCNTPLISILHNYSATWSTPVFQIAFLWSGTHSLKRAFNGSAFCGLHSLMLMLILLTVMMPMLMLMLILHL